VSDIQIRDALPMCKRILGMDLSEKIRLALTGDKETRNLLAREQNKLILSYLLQNPRITETEILGIAKGKSLPEEILLMITKKREWMKKYPIRLAVTQNPKTPLTVAMKMLSSIRDTDLRKIGRSRDVSADLSAGARKLLVIRGLL
jgi:hypothetical protein